MEKIKIEDIMPEMCASIIHKTSPTIEILASNSNHSMNQENISHLFCVNENMLNNNIIHDNIDINKSFVINEINEDFNHSIINESFGPLQLDVDLEEKDDVNNSIYNYFTNFQTIFMRFIRYCYYNVITNLHNFRLSFHQCWVIYYMILSLIGSMLISNIESKMDYIDCIFLAVSACTNSGLMTVSMESLSRFSYIVLAGEIAIFFHIRFYLNHI